MKNIEVIQDLSVDTADEWVKDISVQEIFNGPFRRIVEVRLRNRSVLKRHKADVQITVQCLSGTGSFYAGSELDESVALHPGTLITLKAGVEHEVRANPQLHILVSKFKDS
jgi:quercetin dioxygenase-like cupin family protein